MARVGQAAAIGLTLSIVYTAMTRPGLDPAGESAPEVRSALARATPSGRVAVLVDKSTKDLDAFGTSNLRQAGWRWFSIGGGHAEVDAAVRAGRELVILWSYYSSRRI